MKKRTRETTISTASLPDIVFMLLFFFMVVTNMKEDEPKVKNQLPSAQEVIKLKNKSLVTYLYIGNPIDDRHGSSARIQMNDDFIPIEKMQAAILSRVNEFPESDQRRLTTSLKVDKNCQMGIVTDVKHELRAANQLKLNYATVRH